jgi:hypothetical protein
LLINITKIFPFEGVRSPPKGRDGDIENDIVILIDEYDGLILKKRLANKPGAASRNLEALHGFIV